MNDAAVYNSQFNIYLQTFVFLLSLSLLKNTLIVMSQFYQLQKMIGSFVP